MRSKAEALYDRGAARYWVEWGMDESDSVTHRATLQKFLALVGKPGFILSAACGAGRFDGILYEGGHTVLGTDQSAGVLAVARAHFPEDRFPRLRYEKIGLQELGQNPAYQEAFDGAICMDAMEHICPEDYPGILRGFQAVLKPGGVLYFTAETLETAVEDGEDLEEAYAKARAKGFPVVPGEVVDEFDTAYPQAMDNADAPGEVYHNAVYRFYPPLEQVRAWIEQAGLVILEESHGNDVHHVIARRPVVV